MSKLGDGVLFKLKLLEDSRCLPALYKKNGSKVYEDLKKYNQNPDLTYHCKPSQPSKSQGKLLSIGGSRKRLNDFIVPGDPDMFGRLFAPSLTPSMGSVGHHQPLPPAALYCSAPNLTCHISVYISNSISVRAVS